MSRCRPREIAEIDAPWARSSWIAVERWVVLVTICFSGGAGGGGGGSGASTGGVGPAAPRRVPADSHGGQAPSAHHARRGCATRASDPRPGSPLARPAGRRRRRRRPGRGRPPECRGARQARRPTWPPPGRRAGRWPVGGHVHQHGAVDPATTKREVVHAQHRHLVDLGSGSAHSSRSRVSRLAGSPSRLASRAPARPASASPTCSQQPAQQRGASSVAGGQPRNLFGERADLAARVVAEQPTDRKAEHHPPAADRRVGEPALVAAVHPGRGATAVGAGGRARASGRRRSACGRASQPSAWRPGR